MIWSLVLDQLKGSTRRQVFMGLGTRATLGGSAGLPPGCHPHTPPHTSVDRIASAGYGHARTTRKEERREKGSGNGCSTVAGLSFAEAIWTKASMADTRGHRSIG